MRFVSRTLCTALLLTLAPAVAMSQAASPFTVGSKLVSIGVLTGGDYEGIGIGGTVEFGALKLSKSVHLGLGASAGLVRDSEGSGSAKVTASVFPLFGIANLHFSPPSQPKLDLYAGASAGIAYARVSGDFVDDFEDSRRKVPSAEPVSLVVRRSRGAQRASISDSEFGFGIQGGAHFGLTNSMSVTAQIGLIDIPLFYGGVSFKF
jgi:opacity protein-like surface antigen